MNTTGTITEKGQVTVPKVFRDRLGLRPGEKLEFSEVPEGLLIRKRFTEDPVEAVWGILKLSRTVDETVDEVRGGPADP